MLQESGIEKVGGHISFEESEETDLLYWMNKSIKERLEEALAWNKKVWKHLNGFYPLKIELVGGKMSKTTADEDDF